MEAISLQVGLLRILPNNAAGPGAAAGKEAVAQAFDELFLGMLLKDLTLAGTDSDATSGISNDLVRASLAHEMALGQNLGLGKLLIEQHHPSTDREKRA